MTEREELEALRRLAELEARERTPKQPATSRQKIQASAPMRVVQGMRDPVDAGAQLLPKGLEALTGLFGMAPNPVSEFFGNEARRVTGMNNAAEAEYQAARTATGQDGADLARLSGNIVSPANLAIARVLPTTAATRMGQAGRGALSGGVAGAVGAPVEDVDNFWMAKALQAGTGAVVGGIATPAVGALSDRLATRAAGRQVQISPDTMMDDQTLKVILQQEGIDPGKLTTFDLSELKRMAMDAARKGENIDMAAALRAKEFERLGVPFLRGQITRDPTQFARERNLRGVEGVGVPITQRLSEQNRILAQRLSGYADGAVSPYQAGQQASDFLRRLDDTMRGRVDQLYGAARAADGRYANVDVPAFVKSANDALDEGARGYALPAAARNLLNDISAGKVPLNVNTLTQIDSTLSAMQRGASDDAARGAIGVIRNALNNAPIESSAGADAKAAFDVARGAARQRFEKLEQIPALKTVVEGKLAPEKFVDQFVIGGKVDDVKRLMGALQGDEATQVSKQVADFLRQQAFGNSPAGDALFTPSRFQQALQRIGPEKLKAIFGDQGSDELMRIARVGSYINTTPGPAAVNTSNTAAAVMNLLQRVPLLRGAAGAAKSTVEAVMTPVQRSRMLAQALSQQVPTRTAPLTPEAAAQIARALSLAGPIGGAAFAPRL